MNDRIKELAEQAGCKVMDDGEWWIPSAKGLEKVVYTSGVGLEKFAELIVKECAELIIKNSPRVTCKEDFHLGYVSGGYMDAADLIKQHFGVEE